MGILKKRINSNIQKINLDKEFNPFDSIFDFIIENYPVEDYPKILEIAAGNGDFSCRLAEYGYQVTAMDPKISLKKDIKYQVKNDLFHENTDISSYDLGIAIHPCGIHKQIIRNFELNQKALFLMPCYNLTCGSSEFFSYEDNGEWLEYLHNLNPKMKRKDFYKDFCFDSTLNSFSSFFYTK